MNTELLIVTSTVIVIAFICWFLYKFNNKCLDLFKDKINAMAYFVWLVVFDIVLFGCFMTGYTDVIKTIIDIF